MPVDPPAEEARPDRSGFMEPGRGPLPELACRVCRSRTLSVDRHPRHVKGALILDPDRDSRYPWLSLIGIAAIGLFGLVLMVILTP